MTPQTPDTLTPLRRPGAGMAAMRFIAACGAIVVVVALLATALYRLWPPTPLGREAAFPPAFWLTTLLLAGGSLALQQAVAAVRVERQTSFRKALLAALAVGVLFVAAQTYGISWLIRNQSPEAAETGVNAFVTCLTALHAMHFTLAMLLLVWVTLQAFADRYDHEYYWGVAVCSWFWHALGVVWLAILVIFAMAA